MSIVHCLYVGIRSITFISTYFEADHFEGQYYVLENTDSYYLVICPMNGEVSRVRQLAAGWCYHSVQTVAAVSHNGILPFLSQLIQLPAVRGLGEQAGSQECGNVAHCHNTAHHHANTLYHHTSLTRIREVVLI